MPAFFNGVFGHKPSPGVVSNHGQYPKPITEEQSRFLGLGPMCRRAEDLLPIMKVISDKHIGRLKLNEEVDIKKLRWFYQETDTGSLFVSPVAGEIRALFTKIAKHLEKAHGIQATKVLKLIFVTKIKGKLQGNINSFQDKYQSLSTIFFYYFQIGIVKLVCLVFEYKISKFLNNLSILVHPEHNY